MNIQEQLTHANQLRAKGKLDAAVSTYRRILKVKPNHGIAHRELGRVALGLNDVTTAQRHLGKALKTLGDDAATYEALGDLYAASGQHGPAIEAYGKAKSIEGPTNNLSVKEAACLTNAGQWQAAANILQAVLQDDPGHTFAHIGLGDILRDCGQGGLALRSYATAAAYKPTLPLAQTRMKSLVDRSIQRWHFPMMNDEPRNRAFQSAIQRGVSPGDTVLDIGTGSGLLAMMAARAGAKKVYACDDNKDIINATAEVVKHNGLSEQIELIPKRSTSMQLGTDIPERADVLVCEIFDAGVLGEDALWTIQQAYEALLKPSAKVIPSGARVWAAPVESKRLAGYFQVGEVCGFDLSPFNRLADSRLLQIDLQRHEYQMLTDPFVALEIPFGADTPLSGRRDTQITVKTPGRCDGFVFWYELLQDGEPFLSTSAEQSGTHWRQAFMPHRGAEQTLEMGRSYGVSTQYQRYLLWFELARG